MAVSGRCRRNLPLARRLSLAPTLRIHPSSSRPRATPDEPIMEVGDLYLPAVQSPRSLRREQLDQHRRVPLLEIVERGRLELVGHQGEVVLTRPRAERSRAWGNRPPREAVLFSRRSIVPSFDPPSSSMHASAPCRETTARGFISSTSGEQRPGLGLRGRASAPGLSSMSCGPSRRLL